MYVAVCMQSLEEDLKSEKRQHADAQQTLERVLRAKDEQCADLKEANQKLQDQIEKLDSQLKSSSKTPARPSDRFKVCRLYRMSGSIKL